MEYIVLGLVGSLVHFVLLVGVYDVEVNKEVYTGSWKNCTNQPISRRLVLFLAEGLGDGVFQNAFNKNTFFIKQKDRSVWGTAVGTNLMKLSGLTTIASGFERQSGLLLNLQEKKITEYDNIFNYANRIIFIGSNHTLSGYEKSSSVWTNIFLSPDDPVGGSGNQQDKGKEIIDKLTQVDTHISKMENLVIIVYFKNSFNMSDQNQYINSLEENIMFLSNLFETFFEDRETTHILTSDKVALSKNGGGSRAAFVMWGNQVKYGENVSIEMTDINVMVSYILGNPVPLSSVGIWREGFFHISPLEELKAKACNALHLASLANSILQRVGNRVLRLIGFGSSIYEEMLDHYERKIIKELSKGLISNVSVTSDSLINLSLKIINNDAVTVKGIIKILMHLTYVGWGLLLLTIVMLNSVTRDNVLKLEINLIQRRTQSYFFGMNVLVSLLALLCCLFVVIQGWPLYYVAYFIAPILIWGCVLNYINYWIGFIIKLNFQRYLIILVYTVIYAALIESYIWGLSYDTVVMGNVLFASVTHLILCYIKKEFFGIKLCTLFSALMLAFGTYLSLNQQEINVMLLLPSTLVWPTGGLFSTFYMWVSGEILDALVMIVCVAHYCASSAMAMIHTFFQSEIFFIISTILLASAGFVPLMGRAITPSTDIPQDIDRYKKINRLHHTSVCLGSMAVLFSLSFEPLFAYSIYVYLIMWYLVVEPSIKIETINRENAHNAITFVTIVIVTQHLLGLQLPTEKMPYVVGYAFYSSELMAGVMYIFKFYIVLAIAQVIFTSLTLSSGGDSQLTFAMLHLNMCGYRLFIDMYGLNDSNRTERKMHSHISLQVIIILLFLTFPIIKILLQISICQIFISIRTMLNAMIHTRNRRI